MILTVGSINMDFVVRVNRHPAIGETVIGSNYETHFGGKGANQAIAAARIGAEVHMIGAVGDDEFGKQLLGNIRSSGVDSTKVVTIQGASGVAFICVDEYGQNTIVVAPGANSHLSHSHLLEPAFKNATIVLLQFEIPMETVQKSTLLAKKVGAKVVLNAAPIQNIPFWNLDGVDVLIVNEVEAGMMLKSPSATSPEEALSFAADLLKYVPTVVITLGEKGVVWKTLSEEGYEKAFPVEAVDTTAAGDAFVGVFTASLNDGHSLKHSIYRANAAGALATTRHGAQTSLPSADELENFLLAVN